MPVHRGRAEADSSAYPVDQSAAGVSLHTGQDSLTVRAEAAGWAWLRVPWDPDWHSTGDTPVHKGGPGHLVVWAERGVTELRWSVPGTVDAAAAAITGASALALIALVAVNRRRGFQAEPDRRRPAADAFEVFADTVDGWVRATSRRARLVGARARRRETMRLKRLFRIASRVYRIGDFNRKSNSQKDSTIVFAVIALSLALPIAAGAAYLALRGRLPNLVADVRGIALQTVIIMVVLLAIAGGVAAVLLSRGGEAVTDIERQQISRSADRFLWFGTVQGRWVHLGHLRQELHVVSSFCGALVLQPA